MKSEYGLAKDKYKRKAKGALSAIEQVGTSGLSEDGRKNLDTGLKCGLVCQDEVDHAQHNYMIAEANLALNNIAGRGKEKGDDVFLEYGLKHGEFNQDDIDFKMGTYRKHRLLERVREFGIRNIQVSSVLDIWSAVNDGIIPKKEYLEAVSYTHLTLPTTPYV